MSELPVPGETSGPTWAQMINDAITARLTSVGGSIRGYRESVVVPTATTGTVTLDLAEGNIFRLAPTGNVAITVANQVSGFLQPFTLIVMNATYTITLPVGTKFPNGTAPVLNGQTWLSGVSDENNILTIGASWGGVA